MIITPEEMIPRFAKIRQYAVSTINYHRTYIERQLGVAFPGMTFQIISWERISRSQALIDVKITKDDQVQRIEFELPCKRVPAVSPQRMPRLSMNRSNYAFP